LNGFDDFLLNLRRQLLIWHPAAYRLKRFARTSQKLFSEHFLDCFGRQKPRLGRLLRQVVRERQLYRCHGEVRRDSFDRDEEMIMPAMPSKSTHSVSVLP
jgi:hypothetical protein